MTRGDDLFNARDWTALDDVHHPDMIAFIPGSAEPIYGRKAHGAAMQQLVRMFPDVRVHTRTRSSSRRRLDHRGHQRHRDVHRRDDPARRQSDSRRPERRSTSSSAQTSKWEGDQLIVISRLLGRRRSEAADRPRVGEPVRQPDRGNDLWSRARCAGPARATPASARQGRGGKPGR